MISLQPLKEFKYPIWAECISPDGFQGKTLNEIAAIKVWEGNKQKTLAELFNIRESHVENQDDVLTVEINGDVSKLRGIGQGTSTGEVKINGDAGMHLGEEMKGGRITVHGNTGGWTGAIMKGGVIEVHGNAGDYVGAPYRGSTKGMSGGRIIIHGNVGVEAGANLKTGMIKIYGNAGQFAGFRMQEGTIYVQGNCEERTGACMKNGRIIIGGHLESVLPSFTIDAVRPKIKIEEDETAEGPFYVFLGDLVENGNGKLYVSKDKNPQLNPYEKYL